MSSSRPLPEAVRGSWYLASPSFFDDQADDPSSLPDQLLAFAVNGTYVRYDLSPRGRKEKESGDYSFDGNFLILRGRRTHTYRVQRPAFWKWELEGKRKSHLLVRGFDLGTTADLDLGDEQRRDLALLPVRARVETDRPGDHAIHRLLYEQEGESPRLLATFSVEPAPDGHLWIGLAPFVDGIEPRTWERILRESYLGLFRGKPTDIKDVIVHLLADDQTFEFTYRP